MANFQMARTNVPVIWVPATEILELWISFFWFDMYVSEERKVIDILQVLLSILLIDINTHYYFQ